MHRQRLFLSLLVFIACGNLPVQAVAADIRLLFMGDNGLHRPEDRFQQLASALDERGVTLKYTDRMEDLTADTLAEFDGLVLYANIDNIEDKQARAVLDYVASGGGFVPLHCATYCWRNNADMVALMGAQFQQHGGQVFTTSIAESDHPIMKGYSSFTSWDETYVHHRHNEQNRTVLEYRIASEQAKGNDREPWTWVRTHGKGRIFYTAWGHDERTFGHPGFHNLVERGIRWACGADPFVVPEYQDADTFVMPPMTQLRKDVAPFEYVEVGPKIPSYTPGTKWGVQGKPRTAMQQPLSPEESLKHYVTLEGMAVRLYADERNFAAKPIAMNWDERGRLWVCETVDYPNQLGQNRDRIRICEDTDGDHVADKFTVFAEALSIPTALVIYRGGAVVQSGTETIYLKDTNGDDVADVKTKLITNWALGDTHGGVSNFRYGLDNWIWAMQGYNNSTPHVDGKPTQTFRMGFWRFKLSNTDPPKVTDLEFVRSSNNNTWGLGISEDGLIFGSTANHNPSMFLPIPNRYYENVRGWSPPTLGTIADTYKFKPITENIRQVDQFGGYTAAAGHALYTARAFPKQWWNRTAFVCGPTGHLVGTFVLRPEGANYSSTTPGNLLASDDEWSAPIMAEVGPDGAVWVIDWYNYIVQHNPTPQGFETGKGNAYESDLRDKKHGRILRVVATDSDATDVTHPFTSLDNVSNLELVNTLKHPSFMWRLTAQRLLIERRAGENSNVLSPLLSLLDDQTVDAAGLNVGAIHALHTLAGLGYITLEPRRKATGMVRHSLAKAMSHPSNAVRRNTIAVLPSNRHTLNFLMKQNAWTGGKNPQVDLQLLLKIAELPPFAEDAYPDPLAYVLAGAIETTRDPVLLDALSAAAAANGPSYLGALCYDPLKVALDILVGGVSLPAGANPDFPASSANLNIARRIAEHIARGNPDATTLGNIIGQLSRAENAVANRILDGLIAGLSAKSIFQTTDRFNKNLVNAFARADSTSKSKLIRLAAQCGTHALDAHAEEVVKSLLASIRDRTATDDERVSSALDLIGFRPESDDTVIALIEQLDAHTPPELGVQLLSAIQQSRSTAAGRSLVEVATTLPPQLKSATIGTLISRPELAMSLLAGIENRQIELSDLTLDQKQSLRAFPDEQLREQAERLFSMSGGLPDADRDKILQSLLHLCDQEGDIGMGREMFKKHCAKCHRHGDMGKHIGPNLTGMAVHPKAELLTHIIDPSRSVEGNFRIYTVVRSDGRVASGMLAGETRTSVTLIDTEGKETSIQREDIDELLASKKSVMPEGFEKQMTELELSNLLQFLSNKGKYVPIPLDRCATAISTKGLFHQGDNGPDRMVFTDWNPKVFKDVPFLLTDPRGKTTANIILLNGPRGTLPPKMPRSVTLPCNSAAKAIHLLSGVGGWSYPAHSEQTVSMTVRLHYADGSSEDHDLINGIHFADYIRRVDVPGSEFAFDLNGQQIRYLSIAPESPATVESLELIKGSDPTAPIVMAITVER